MQYHAAIVAELQKPTVWCAMGQICKKTHSVDLGNGTASGSPPQFYLDNLKKAIEMDPYDYVTEGGSISLLKAIAFYHKEAYPNINPQQNILVVNGAHVGQYASFAAFINPGDQVILFDPSYTYYRKQAYIHQGIIKGITLYPKIDQSRQSLKQRIQQQIKFQQSDQWTIDFDLLQKSFTPKTKMILINSPHNPTGKIFSNSDLDRIANLLRKNPQTIIIEDNIYEGYTFDHFNQKSILKLSQRPQFQDRILSIYSAGKLFKATGVRIGWVIGSSPLINLVKYANRNMYSYNSGILQKCIELSLYNVRQPTNHHISEQAARLQHNRNIIIHQLCSSNLDINIWVPQSGYFILVDISNLQVKEEYLKDEQGNVMTHDFACAYQLAHDYHVAVIPCSPFFGKQDKTRSKYVRLAYCKDEQNLREMGRRLCKQI